MKAFIGIEIALVGIVFVLAIVLVALLPILFLRIHFIQTIELQNKYSNVQLELLAFLSSTTTDTNSLRNNQVTVFRLLSDYLATGQPSSIDNLKYRLDKLSDCYILYSSTNALFKSSTCNADQFNSTQAKIPLPYNPSKLTETLTLVIN